MNIRNAILSAADSIENNPSLYEFGSCDIASPDCGTPGCALGWIGLHLGLQESDNLYAVCDAIGAKCTVCFYALSEAVGSKKWYHSADECAKALRLYADKYHPQQDYIPASIRAIFTEQVAA